MFLTVLDQTHQRKLDFELDQGEKPFCFETQTSHLHFRATDTPVWDFWCPPKSKKYFCCRVCQ